MENSDLATNNRSEEAKKPKTLPPLNQNNTPKLKKEIQNDQLHQVQAQRKLPSAVKNTQSIKKKQRKFIVDEYDEKAIVLCQFCGGQKCPQEDFRTNKIQPNAIEGLHSNWINENILATQRPSNRLIKQYNLLQTFEKYNLNFILNLQQPGEHPYCGDGIDPMVGFSYDPQLFFARKIRFENQFWEDMTSTTFEQMMKIMNIFYRSIIQKKGKIAVHCHAGRGRTLMAICSWLIYNDRMTAQQTIDLAILRRQGVLTRTSQRDFLRDFQIQLHRRWKSFDIKIEDAAVKTFKEFVDWQNEGLLKSQRKKLNETAFAHGTILSILRGRMRNQCREILFSFIDLNDNVVFGERKWDKEHQHRLTFLKTYLDKKKLDEIKQNQDIRIVAALLEDFYDNLPFTPISLHAVDQLKEELELQKKILKSQNLKRKVKKQTLNNKILKRWSEIVQERQSNSPPLKKLPKEQLESLEVPKTSKQINQVNHEIDQPFESKNLSGQLLDDNSKNTQQSFPRINGNSSSEIEVNTLYLSVLTEPSVVHQVGLNSLCTIIDLVKFSMQLISCYRNLYQKQTEEHFNRVQRCLLAKFSLLLQSKKKYFPILFKGPNLRQSILMKKIQKLEKYLNHNIKYMAEDFMRNLMEQLRNFLGNQNSIEQNYRKLILKIQKVNANVIYFSNTLTNSGQKFFSAEGAKKVYDNARI